ncbi:MAG: damage-control phosphatase ARMT1 family protein [Candidatus Methanospirareceae archaeon]
MRPKSDCIACLVERTKYECDLAFSSSENEREKISALREVLAFLVEHLGEEGRSPAFFGTERERIIKKRSSASGGARDIHAEVKRRSNEVARGLLPVARKFYEAAASGAGERAERGRASKRAGWGGAGTIEALVRIAAAANSMEYGVKGHSYDDAVFKEEFVQTVNERLNWAREEVVSALEGRERILYLTDNAGEVFFDAFVVKELVEEFGKAEVVVSPKSTPVLNDATTKDLKEAFACVGVRESKGERVPEGEGGVPEGEGGVPEGEGEGWRGRVRVVPSGSCIGVSLEEAGAEFLEVFSDERYLVVAKGMGNYESISEFEAKPELRLRGRGRLLYIFRAKCEPIASSVGVKRGELVAKLV